MTTGSSVLRQRLPEYHNSSVLYAAEMQSHQSDDVHTDLELVARYAAQVMGSNRRLFDLTSFFRRCGFTILNVGTPAPELRGVDTGYAGLAVFHLDRLGDSEGVAPDMSPRHRRCRGPAGNQR
jgi:hypothetical protein